MKLMQVLRVLVLALVALEQTANAEAPTSGMHRVGYLGRFPPTAEAAPILGAFVGGLRTHGYIEGKNLTLEYRYSHGRDERWPGLVRELLQLNVQVIAAADSAAAQAVRAHSPTIPVVLLGASDPVGTGLVASLARPGGNITGLSNQLGDLEAKTLQLVLDVAPRVSRLAVFWNPDNAGSAASLRTLQTHAAAGGLTVHPVVGRTPQEMDDALAALARQRPDALAVHLWYSGSPERARIAEFAARAGIVTVSGSKRLVGAGLLMSYAPDSAAIFRRGADYVHKILQGARPADLPIEQPTKVELVLNLRTAKALGLTIPPSILLQATEVIE
jgi:putative ABC transport system substrate-binding protein